MSAGAWWKTSSPPVKRCGWPAVSERAGGLPGSAAVPHASASRLAVRAWQDINQGRSNIMGAWGSGTFENDDACDLVCDLRESTDLSLLEDALRTAAETDEDLDAGDGSKALAAAEVILALLGNPSPAIAEEEDLQAWMKANPQRPTAALLALAERAVQQVTAEDSELRELWDEADSLDEWMAEVNTLQAGLRAARSAAG
ncbi:hypothetical protein C1929_15675 [Stenotrophomonas sp. ZAC14D1_NAIMI4_6]|nr:hypothetical protein C1929_15675 [Stenotrophomonas sp. ZAC14D1_NAIMI4_6]AWH42226.1 hypothetical protein C1927_15680 [Stenotrophomonas sp. ZAC14D1_NAIMI4_1]